MANLEPLAVSVTEAAKLLGVSRPTMYTLLNQEGFPSFRVGGRRLIPLAAMRRWIAEQMGEVS